MELIDKAKLYNAIAEIEDKATDNFLKESQASQHKLVYMGELGELRGITTIKYLVADFPTVEAVPVVHGEWIDTQPDYHHGCGKNAHVCSSCQDYYTPDYEYMNFCPHCGADMRKKE